MQLASLFQDHAVLQRRKPIPVWGTGTPGERVTVRFAGAEARTTVDGTGRWMLRLPAMKEGGPYTLEAEAPSGKAVAGDLLVGEVWIASGQSNMGWTLKQAEPEGALQPLPQVRLLTVKNPAELGCSEAVVGKWEIATPEALAEFSAVAGYFGRFLQGELGVPVGVICNAWGGTRVQAWMSREALMLEPEGRDEIRFYEALIHQPDASLGIPTMETWERQEPFFSPEPLGLEQGWACADFDDSAWGSMTLPGYWQSQGHPHSGVFWFRKTVKIPPAWLGRELELSLGPIDKHDETWVNGSLVGSTGWEARESWIVPRLYRVAAGLVDAGGAVAVAVRARSHAYAGGFAGSKGEMWLAPVGAAPSERIVLDGSWRYAVEHDWGVTVPPKPAWGPGNPNTPAILFNHRVAPLIPYGVRGFIWYQGESNVGEANLYRRLLPGMIEDWRRAWGGGALPFIQVQLANYLTAAEKPAESIWAALRDAQAEALALEGTGLAVAIDLGEAGNIHPFNKRDVGFRLAQCALHQVYDRASAPVSPLFDTMVLEEGGRVRCAFRHTGGGLVAKGGPLRHFAVAGLDRIFHWAEAVIEGETVVVSCPEVPRPFSVRYAWNDNPEGCNLYGAGGLPVAPFRSDAWPVV